MKLRKYSIRAELLSTFFICSVITIVIMMGILWMLMQASSNKPFAVFFLKHVLIFGVFLFSVLIGILILLFLLMTNRRMKYFEEIHKTLEGISGGNLDVNMSVKGSDELAELALAVNNMSFRLKSYIEEEKLWEKTKNDMITNISHDLRSPLTSILGYLELIVNEKYKDKDALNHYADIAYNKCKNLKILVEELFEYSKLNSADIKVNKVELSLTELLGQVVLGFMPIFNQYSMEYKLDMPAEKIKVIGDPQLLARLFDNIINNAINYGKEGRLITFELLKENNSAVVRISNLGKDIPEEDLPHIFERFYKADKSRSVYKNGSGIGLAIVKSIVDLHSGRVSASSIGGKTTFEVMLPQDAVGTVNN